MSIIEEIKGDLIEMGDRVVVGGFVEENACRLKEIVAEFEDKLLVRSGREQLYGTAFKFDENWNLEIFPIKEKVDERRLEVGLDTLEDAINRLEKFAYNMKNR